jgi:hypothetical protein
MKTLLLGVSRKTLGRQKEINTILSGYLPKAKCNGDIMLIIGKKHLGETRTKKRWQ